jgi:lipopolysaccharide transport system permease protein
LWSNRGLLWQFTLRNIEVRHKGSALGFTWSVLNPLLNMSLYVFIFGYIFGSKFNVVPNESRLDYALALFLGLTLFQLFAEILAVAPTLVVSNPNFVKKVVFPLEVLPAAAVGSSLFHSLISLVLVLTGICFWGPGLSANVLWLPVILLSIVPFALGLGWMLSALGVFFRDIAQMVGFFSTAWMYASAIFFPIQIIPAAAWTVLRFNPLLLAIDLARNAVMWRGAINLHHLGYLILAGIASCLIGHWFFRKTAPAFADVL